MSDNYLITGYWGEPHVTAENDRGINAAIFGTGRFVLPVGEQFRAEYIGNNTVRMYDGKLMNNGAAAGIPAGRYVDLMIPEATQNMKKNCLIVFQYEKDVDTLYESGKFVVYEGSEVLATETPKDPALAYGDLLSDKVYLDQMPLWRVTVTGAVISAPEQLFGVSKNIQSASAVAAHDLEGYVPIEGGGTGANTLAKAQKNLQIYPAVESTEHPGCYYRTVGDETEWINPPMKAGVEYRTTERFMGAPVYTAIAEGTIPATGESSKIRIAMGVSGLLRYNAITFNNAAATPYVIPLDVTHEISTTILRIIVDNPGGTYTAGEKVVAQAWYIREDLSELT